MSGPSSSPAGQAPVLVTGGTGFLGGAVAGVLMIKHGLPVRLLYRRASRRLVDDLIEDGPPLPMEPVEGDVTDLASLARAAKGCRAIVHVAAHVSRSGARRLFEDVNVGGLRNVLRAGDAAGVERVVYTSSFFALGPSDPEPGRPSPPEGLDESALRAGVADLDSYQFTKHQAAMLALDAMRAGAPLVMVIPGALLGRGRSTEGNFVTTMIRDHLNGRLPALPEGGRRRWSFVDVQDVAEGHVLALEKGRIGEAYVLGGENRTLAELFGMVFEMTGKRPPLLGLPYALSWSVGLAEEALEALIGRTPTHLTRGAARLLRREWALSSAKAARELGYAPEPLRLRLWETLAWLQLAGLVPKGTVPLRHPDAAA